MSVTSKNIPKKPHDSNRYRWRDVAFVICTWPVTAPLYAKAKRDVLKEFGEPIYHDAVRLGQSDAESLKKGIYKKIIVRKLRTMTREKYPDGTSLPDKERERPVGLRLRKRHLDELPQLFHNVWKHKNMSIIGWRTKPLRELQNLGPVYEEKVRQMTMSKPGITGWVQIMDVLRLPGDPHERAELDPRYVTRTTKAIIDLNLYYEANRTFLSDTMVLLGTVAKLVGEKWTTKASIAILNLLDAEAKRTGRLEDRPAVINEIFPNKKRCIALSAIVGHKLVAPRRALGLIDSESHPGMTVRVETTGSSRGKHHQTLPQWLEGGHDMRRRRMIQKIGRQYRNYTI